jgi:hypothetical protein
LKYLYLDYKREKTMGILNNYNVGSKMILIPLTAAILFSGCATKVTMRGLEPAAVDKAAKSKKIAVVGFLNDTISQSSQIESALARFNLDNEPYFTVASRMDLKKILQEQKFNQSGYIDKESQMDLGQMIGVEAIVSGEVNNIELSRGQFQEGRTDTTQCVKTKKLDNGKITCLQNRQYKVNCIRNNYSVNTTVKILSVKTGEIIYSDGFVEYSSGKLCADQNRALPSLEAEATHLASKIATKFVKLITPSYYHYEVNVIESPDIEYSPQQEELFDAALEFLKVHRYDKSLVLTNRLISSTQNKSYVALYLKALILEAQGELESALQFYNEADQLTMEPVEDIDTALSRVHINIQKFKKASSQVKS